MPEGIPTTEIAEQNDENPAANTMAKYLVNSALGLHGLSFDEI